MHCIFLLEMFFFWHIDCKIDSRTKKDFNMNSFIITDHALYRQWDRGIDRRILSKVYPFVTDSRNKKQVVFVMPSFFKSQGVPDIINQCLILIVRGKYLVTCYWRNLSECLFGQKYYVSPQILC